MSARRRERGLTLVEVLVAVVISGIIFGALVQASLIGLRTIDNTNDRLAGSNDTQLVASYFTGDVDSADTISTTGAVRHSAPGVNVGSANSMLVSFWALRTGTTFTPPVGMTERWDLQSTGPNPPARLTATVADGAVAETGPSGNRIGESAAGTSSIGHTIALARTTLFPVTHRGASTGATAGAASLTLAKPGGTQDGDQMLAHVAVASTATITAPAGWTVVNERAASSARSVLYRKVAASGDPLNWTWTFSAAAESVGGVASYGNVQSVGNAGTDISPCGGETPVLLLGWTDFGDNTVHEVTYSAQAEGDEIQLVRRACRAISGGTPRSATTLARRLQGTGPPDVFAECVPVACAPLAPSVAVTLTLTEAPLSREFLPRVYQMRGTTRTNR